MTPKVNTGMWLCQPEKKEPAWLLSAAAALAACTVALMASAVLTGFADLYTPWVMVLTGGGLCLLHGAMAKLHRRSWFYPGVLLILVLAVVLFGESFRNGIGLIWNQIADQRTAATGWMLPQLQTEPNRGLLQVSLVAGGIAALLCCALCSCRQPVMAAVLPAGLLAGMVYFHRTDVFIWMLPVLLVSIFLLVCSGKDRETNAVTLLMGGTAPAILIAALLLISLNPQISARVKDDSLELQKRSHIRAYETDYTVLPEGDFSRFSPQDDTAHPALAVTMEKPETLYLRGFTGAVFEGDTWSALDTGILAENKDLLYWLNTNAFSVQAQFSAAAEFLEMETNTVTVQNIGACSRYRYIPFSMAGGAEPEMLSPDSLLCDAERYYRIRVVADSANRIGEVLETLQTSQDAAVLTYRRAESAYRDFVYAHYLQIPQEVRTMLQDRWEQYGSPDQSTPQQAQTCVRSFLEDAFREEAAMELPLSQAADTDYQYATVAVLTLRYFGIPARYAEGYRITEEAARAAEGETIQADSSFAGAWAEVYQDGIGWIPMELTQGFTQSEGTQEGKQNASAQATLKEGQELEQTPENAVQEPEPEGGSMVRVAKTIRWSALLFAGLFLLLAGIAALRRGHILAARARCFEQKNSKEAVARIYGFCTVLLKELGFDRGNGSMRMLCKPIAESMGEDYGEAFRRMTELNARSIFSSHPIDDSQRAEMLTFYETTLQHLKQRTKWPKRLWQQWIRCLY